jgi:hypothetical protein
VPENRDGFQKWERGAEIWKLMNGELNQTNEKGGCQPRDSAAAPPFLSLFIKTITDRCTFYACAIVLRHSSIETDTSGV